MTIGVYYVDSVGGDDSNDGLSLANAWATLGEFMDSADWAGSDGLVCHVHGSHTLTASLDPANANADYIPFEFRGATGAEITLAHTVNTGFLGNWGYRRCIVRSLTINLNQTSNQYWTSQSGLMSVGCTFNITGGSKIVFMGSAPCVDCTFTGDGTAGSLYFTGSKRGYIDGCLFDTIHYLSIANNSGQAFHILRSRFVDCGQSNGFTAFLSLTGPSNSNNHHVNSVIRNCSFHDCYTGHATSKASLKLLRSIATVENCVFSFSTTGKLAFSTDTGVIPCKHGNYIYNATESSEYMSGANATTLTALPYTDPSNNDWTLSSELAALTDSKGFTPGGKQATSSGGGGSSRTIFESPAIFGA